MRQLARVAKTGMRATRQGGQRSGLARARAGREDRLIAVARPMVRRQMAGLSPCATSSVRACVPHWSRLMHAIGRHSGWQCRVH